MRSDLAYTDRVVISGAPLDPSLVEGVLECMLRGVLSETVDEERNR